MTGGINGTTHAYNNTTALVSYTTSFDRASNKLYERHLEGGESRSHLYQPFNSDGSWGVGYDSANRLRQYQRGVLSSATIPYLVNAGASITTPTTLPGANQIRTYGLDGLGNWRNGNFTTVISGDSTTSTTESRAHNYVNEITSITDTTGGTSTPTPLTYDKNGNLLNDGIRIYQYDALNRLIYIKSVSTGDLLATYVYDALNRRIQKTISNGGLPGDLTNGTTDYLYDDRQIVEERQNLISPYNWTKVYFWGQYLDELMFFAVPTATVYRALSDLLYRSVAIVTTSNVVTEVYDCDAYGNTLCYSGPGTDGLWFTNDDVKTNAPTNTTIFTGRQYDPESQIYYYRARYYAPSLGRFISRDPLGSLTTMDLGSDASGLSVIDKSLFRLAFRMTISSERFLSRLERLGREPMTSAELLQGPNLYEYVYDNPTNRMDPSGLQPPVAVGAGIGTLVEPGGGTAVGAAIGLLITGALALLAINAIQNSQTSSNACKNWKYCSFDAAYPIKGTNIVACVYECPDGTQREVFSSEGCPRFVIG